MHLIDRFINSIFICSSLQSIVLEIVNSFQEKDTPAVIGNLVFDGLPSKEVVDCEEHAGMDAEVHRHFVL